MSTMPPQKPGKSKQDYGTPPGFLEAVKIKLNTEFVWDLAASEENKVCANYYSFEQNALLRDWSYDLAGGWGWLNPPFEDIYPWAEKTYLEAIQGAHIAMLVPLSIAEWWTDWVDQKSYVLMLHGRLTFVGEKSPYPKDCALLLYGPEGFTGYECWSWRD